jgi:hypothetical protein
MPAPPPLPTPPGLAPPSASLLKAARRLLRPLVGLMMRSGVTFPVLADALRHLFVEVASSDILTDAKARTDSRISLLTGIHRKDIKRLRDVPADNDAAPEVVTLASQIIARWVGSAPFTGPDGCPLDLIRTTRGRTGEASFDALVESVTTDIRPRAVLETLLSHGIVTVLEQDRIHLNADAFIPRPGGEEQLFYFARNLHDHVAAAVHNIAAAGTAPFMDRSVHYDCLTPSQARALDAFARSLAMRALLAVNRRALELTEAPDPEAVANSWRVNFGVYVFNEDEQSGTGDVT